jgi:hypothetical protein
MARTRDISAALAETPIRAVLPVVEAEQPVRPPVITWKQLAKDKLTAKAREWQKAGDGAKLMGASMRRPSTTRSR